MPDGGSAQPSPAIYALIALRFLLELALWASFTVSCVRLIDGPLGWVVGLALTAAVTVVWGLLLSPRRRVRLPVAELIDLALLQGPDGNAIRAGPGTVRPAGDCRVLARTPRVPCPAGRRESRG